MPSVRLIHLTKSYRLARQGVRAVHDITLEAPQGKILTLLGPSGCGKSTTLRCIAGLERPDDGEILFDDRVIFSRARRTFVPPERRNIGMVFQSYAIWPHLTVGENVAFPMYLRGLPRQAVRDRVRAALELVGLAGLEDRPAPYLSGGQQQRVAVARALVYEPEVLLLDEPLSNLDAKVREQVREELRALQRRLGITTVYVTHDQLEALALSDVVAVMQDGVVVEVGMPQELYSRPKSHFTATFLGEITYLPGTVGSAAQTLQVVTPAGALQCQASAAVLEGTRVIAGIRPEHVRVSAERPPGESNVFEGRVASTLFEGSRVKYRIAVGDLHMLAYGAETFPVGARVYVIVDADRVILLPELGEAA